MRGTSVSLVAMCLVVFFVGPYAARPTEASGSAGSDVGSHRVIELEADAAIRFTQDGEAIDSISVVPGETVVFRIDNTAGFEQNFYIGTIGELSSPSAVTTTGISTWSSGIRELEWSVPADVSDLMYGSTVPGHFDAGMQGRFEAVTSLPPTTEPVEPSPAAGTWSPAGESVHGRSSFAMAGLPGDRVLVVGGAEEEERIPAEIWDPSTASFALTGTPKSGRHFHTATLLPDGRVLVVGGAASPGTGQATPELWDPATGSFSPTGSMDEARSFHTATPLPDGRVLVIGGTSTEDHRVLASAEVFDPATETFAPAGSMARARVWHTATPLPDGRVLVTGGTDADASKYYRSAEVWDPATSMFSWTGGMSLRRWQHAATPLPDGRVLVVGGITEGGDFPVLAEVWDPATSTFSPAGWMAAGRFGWHSAITLSDGRVLVVGGTDDAAAELWDPATADFTPGGSFIQTGGGPATLLREDRVLVVGTDRLAEIWEPSKP